jgi:hypothetical protein
LYGHIAGDIGAERRQYIKRTTDCRFGEMHENGNWPHLHFQIISDMELKKATIGRMQIFGKKNTNLP